MGLHVILHKYHIWNLTGLLKNPVWRTKRRSMARIPDEEIERLKKEIPIERLVTGFGV